MIPPVTVPPAGVAPLAGVVPLAGGVPLAGNFKEVSLLRLFHYLKVSCKTGVLTSHHASVSKTLSFEQGNILFATSNYPDDYLGEILLKAGKINFKQYEIVEAYLKSTGKTQGAILVEQGFVKPKDLFDTLLIQMKEIALSLFSWEEAPYNFKESPLASEASIGISIDPDEVIYDGLARVFDWTRLVRFLPSLDTVLKKNPVQISNPFKLASHSDWVWSLIDNEGSVRNILMLSSSKALSCAQILNFFITTEMLIPSIPVFKKTEETPDKVIEKKISPMKQERKKAEEEVSWENESKEVQIKKIKEVFAKISSQNYYQMLGVPPDAEKGAIKQAYFKLVKRYHPDRYTGGEMFSIIKEVKAIFIDMTRAYDTLLVDKDRSDYDRLLNSAASQQPAEVQSAQDFFYRAQDALSENDPKNALYFLEEAIRLSPESPEKSVVYLLYGQILSRVPGKLREAETALRKSATLDSSKAIPHVELGLVYAKAGLNSKATAAFQDAIRRDPENKTALAELAKLNIKK